MRRGKGITAGQVVGDGSGSVALAVDGEAEFFDFDRLGVPHGEGRYVVGHSQVLRDLACGIVVARNDEDGDALLSKPCHLGGEEKPGVVVLPIAVVEIPRKQDEVDLLRGGQFD